MAKIRVGNRRKQLKRIRTFKACKNVADGWAKDLVAHGIGNDIAQVIMSAFRSSEKACATLGKLKL